MVDVEDIITAVCDRYLVSRDEMVSPSRSKTVTAARHQAMFEIRRETILSLPEIGRIFNRNHATVFRAVRKVEEAQWNSNEIKARW